MINGVNAPYESRDVLLRSRHEQDFALGASDNCAGAGVIVRCCTGTCLAANTADSNKTPALLSMLMGKRVVP